MKIKLWLECRIYGDRGFRDSCHKCIVDVKNKALMAATKMT